MSNFPRSFNEVLAEVDSGRLIEDLSRQLAEVTNAAIATNKVGELVLTLKVKPNKDNQVFLDSTVKAKVPEHSIATALFFANEEGSLTRRDPKQGDMFALKPALVSAS